MARSTPTRSTASIPTTVERIESVSPEEFVRRFVEPNRPAVIRGLVDRWPAFQRWERPYLVDALKSYEVPLTESRTDGTGKIARVHSVRVADVAPMLLEGRVDLPHFYFAQIRLPESLSRDIELPPYVPASAASAPNLWIGPPGSITRLHYDGFHNILAQVRGRKRLTLFSPADRSYLYCVDKRPPEPIASRVNVANPDFEEFPLFAKATPYEVVVEPGEALFLPQGWAHYVEGLDRSVSVNFWWKVHLTQALGLGLPEARNAMGLDLLDGVLKTLCYAYDVTGLDLFDIAASLGRSGRGPRCAQATFELLDWVARLGIDKLRGESATDAVVSGSVEPRVAAELLKQDWTPKWTPADRSEVRVAVTELHAAGHFDDSERELLIAFIERPGGGDGSFEQNCDSIDLQKLIDVLRRAAERLDLRAAFVPAVGAGVPTDMHFTQS